MPLASGCSRQIPVATQSMKGMGLLLRFPGSGSGRNRPRVPTGRALGSSPLQTLVGRDAASEPRSFLSTTRTTKCFKRRCQRRCRRLETRAPLLWPSPDAEPRRRRNAVSAAALGLIATVLEDMLRVPRSTRARRRERLQFHVTRRTGRPVKLATYANGSIWISLGIGQDVLNKIAAVSPPWSLPRNILFFRLC